MQYGKTTDYKESEAYLKFHWLEWLRNVQPWAILPTQEFSRKSKVLPCSAVYVPGPQWASWSSGQHSGSQHHTRMACPNRQTDLWSEIETDALCTERDPIERKTKGNTWMVPWNLATHLAIDHVTLGSTPNCCRLGKFNTRIKHFAQKNFEDWTEQWKFINSKFFPPIIFNVKISRFTVYCYMWGRA